MTGRHEQQPASLVNEETTLVTALLQSDVRLQFFISC